MIDHDETLLEQWQEVYNTEQENMQAFNMPIVVNFDEIKHWESNYLEVRIMFFPFFSFKMFPKVKNNRISDVLI